MRFVIFTDEKKDNFSQETTNAVKKILSSLAETEVLPFSLSNLELLRIDDIVFNLAVGERHDFTQGLIAAALEKMRIPFIGSPAYTHYVCLDKFTTKAVLNAHGIPTPAGAIYDGTSVRGKIPRPPLMVKPVAEGSGIGVDESSLCQDVEKAMKVAQEKYEFFKESILIEKYLEGYEITVGVVGSGDEIEVLPPLEIDFSNLPKGIERYYSKRVKEEFAEQTVYNCPPIHVNDEVLKKVKKTAIEVFKALKARDFIRMDMRIEKDIPYVIEVNSRPGLHPIMSDIPKMVKALSEDYEWLVKKICERTLKEVGGGRWKRKV